MLDFLVHPMQTQRSPIAVGVVQNLQETEAQVAAGVVQNLQETEAQIAAGVVQNLQETEAQIAVRPGSLGRLVAHRRRSRFALGGVA